MVYRVGVSFECLKKFVRVNMESRLILAGLFTCSLIASQVSAEIWSGFRGNSGAAVSAEHGFPVEWSEAKGVLWSTPLPGASDSSPAVTSQRVFITSFDSADASSHVVALNRLTGAVLWQKVIAKGDLIAYGPPELFRHRHNPATPSPCADADENVYAFFGTGDLVSLDRNGVIRWQRNLADDYGPYDLKFGMGSSPRLWKNRLFISCVHKGPSYVVALDTATGKEVWLAERNYTCLGDATDAYTSPMVLEIPGKPPQLVVSGADHVDAYDLESGKRLWENGGLVLENEEYARTIASPAVGDGVVVAPSAKAKHAVVISVTDQCHGEITNSSVSRVLPVLVDCPSPTVYDGLVYSVRDDGVGTCLELKTGKELWKNRMGGERYQASPVVADGNVYFLSLEGKCTVIKAGAEFAKLAENSLPGEFYATPAISDGMIFLRDRSRLIAVGADSSRSSEAAAKFDFDYQPDPSFPQWPTQIKAGAVSGVGVDSKGRVFVLQRVSPPVLCFDASGKFLKSFGENVIGLGHGLTVDAEDRVWVADTGHHMVFQFSTEGKLLGALGKMDVPSEDVDKFNKPTYIVFGEKGHSSVMDGYGTARVVHYREGGKHPEIWGKPGSGPLEFSAPHTGLIDQKGRLIVCDRDNLRIQVLHPQTGELLETWTGFKPFGVAMDPQGRLYVSDGARQQILQLDSKGKEVRAWGKEGTGAGEFKTPHLITSDRQGNLYAAEVGGQRVQKLKRVSVPQ